jgi:hypothetical protein
MLANSSLQQMLKSINSFDRKISECCLQASSKIIELVEPISDSSPMIPQETFAFLGVDHNAALRKRWSNFGPAGVRYSWCHIDLVPCSGKMVFSGLVSSFRDH